VALTKNTSGQMYALTVMTPIVATQLSVLQDTLTKLPQPSPFARLSATHFARLVIIPNRHENGQPAVETLPSFQLLFSATFDGELSGYLDALCSELANEAQAIWSCCEGAPAPAAGAPLKAYLEHNQVQTGLFFSAYPDATVADVVQALDMREAMIDLAIASQGMAPDDLRQAFRERFPQ
jgi:hypothetical protein